MRGIAAKYAHPIENTSGEAIPPFSVVLVTGVMTNADKSLTWSTVKQYDGSDGNIMVTGETAIPSKRKNPETGATENGRGTAYWDDFVYVAVDEDGPLQPGEQWGPKEDQWTITKGGNGFSSQGTALLDSDPLRALFYRGVTSSSVIFGRATSAIGAATSPLSPTAFTFVEFLTDDADVTPHTQEEDTEEKDGVNEWPIGAGVDSIIALSMTKGEWHLLNFVERCADV